MVSHLFPIRNFCQYLLPVSRGSCDWIDTPGLHPLIRSFKVHPVYKRPVVQISIFQENKKQLNHSLSVIKRCLVPSFFCMATSRTSISSKRRLLQLKRLYTRPSQHKHASYISKPRSTPGKPCLVLLLAHGGIQVRWIMSTGSTTPFATWQRFWNNMGPLMELLDSLRVAHLLQLWLGFSSVP